MYDNNNYFPNSPDENNGGENTYDQSGFSNSGMNQTENNYQRQSGQTEYNSTQGADDHSSYENSHSNYQYHNQNYYNDRYRGEHAPAGGNGKKPRKGMGKGPKIAIAAVLLVAFFGVCTGLSFVAVNSVASSASQEAAVEEETMTAEETTQEAAVAAADEIQTAADASAVVTDVSDVVEAVMPSAVSITSNFTNVSSFFGQQVEQEEVASGSGIIIGQNDTELLIVTNNHVVEDADTLQVQFIDNKMVEAQIKGTNSSMDLAVIAVPLDSIPDSTKSSIRVATMGNSDELKIGEPVIAIGNALGYGQSVTTGVVSALNRTLEVDETGTSNALIQTDAAINPGNSGGALLNMKGEVIGINSNKIGGTVVEGMGYAIPISSAEPIIDELMTQETRSRVSADEQGYLGISCINVTSDVSQAYGLPQGIFVAQVYAGTGAAQSGLQKGDIITEIAGNTVVNQEDLLGVLEYYKAGETVDVTVMRGTVNGYEEVQLQITLCSQDDMTEISMRQ